MNVQENAQELASLNANYAMLAVKAARTLGLKNISISILKPPSDAKTFSEKLQTPFVFEGKGFKALVMPIEKPGADKKEQERIASFIEFLEAKNEGIKTARSAAQQAAKDADARDDLFEFHGGLGAIFPNLDSPPRVRKDEVPDVARAPDPENERRLQKNKGVKPSSITELVKDLMTAAFRKGTRSNEFIPTRGKRGKFLATAGEMFRLLKVQAKSGADEINRRVATIVNPLGPQQKIVFERYLLMLNLQESVARGEPLRFGFTPEGIDQYVNQLQEAVDNTPELQKAVATRNAIKDEFVAELQEFGILPDELDREHYFHQQVLSKLYSQRQASRAGVRPVIRSFMKPRVVVDEEAAREDKARREAKEGEEAEVVEKKTVAFSEALDYNTDYLEAEVTWMTEAQIELEKEKWLRDLEERYSIGQKLIDAAKAKNFEILVGGPENVRRIEQLTGEINELAAERPQDSDVRERLANLRAERNELDPTRPFHIEIAIGTSQLNKALDRDKDTDLDFKEIGVLAANDPGPAGTASRRILKAINERKAFIKESIGDEFVDEHDLVPEGYVEWQPKLGTVFYPAHTLPEKIVELIQKGELESLDQQLKELKLDDKLSDLARAVLVLGGARKAYVIPEEIGLQLDSLEKGEPHLATKVLQRIQGLWKQWILMNPTTVGAYNLRNISGDMDAVLAGAPGVLKFIGPAASQLRGYYKGDLDLNDLLRAARDLGVINSGMTAEEIPGLKHLKIFKDLYSKRLDETLFEKGGNAFRAYFDNAREYTEFREDVLRFAAFLHYTKQLKGGGRIDYGGSNRETVNTLRQEMGDDVAAAHLARNLLGDYGNITVTGQWIRANLMPFWSFQEINLKRYPRLAVNALSVQKDGTLPPAQALALSVGLTLRIASLYTMMQLWNHFVYDDEEEELSLYDRANPHVIFWRNSDGTIVLLRNTGALGDFAEWFGVNDAISQSGKLLDGQIPLSGFLKDTIGKAAINKAYGSIRPDIKGLGEFAFGTSGFPDIFNARSVDRGDVLAQTFGVVDEYHAARGVILKDGSRARPGYYSRLIGVTDPRMNALSEMYELRDDYRASIGAKVQGNVRFPRSGFAPLRDAARADNFEAFKEGLVKYKADGGNFKKFKQNLRNLDPISSRLSDEDEIKFIEFLTPLQREKLRVAQDFAADQAKLLLNWWVEAGETIPAAPLRNRRTGSRSSRRVEPRRDTRR